MLAPMMEDRLTTELTNTVLRRMDIVLEGGPLSCPSKELPGGLGRQVLSLPLVGSELFDFEKWVIMEELAVQASKLLVNTHKRPIQVVEAKSKPQASQAAPAAPPSTSSGQGY